MFVVVGNCPKCGVPIYAESPWFAVVPPPSRPSCNCNPIPVVVSKTTSGTE